MIPPLENPFNDNCICCKKYKTVREMDKNCESKRERMRIARRAIYKSKKKED